MDTTTLPAPARPTPVPRTGAEPAASRDRELLRAAVEASRCLLDGTELDASIDAALATVCGLTGFDRVYLVRYDHTLGGGIFVAEAQAPGIRSVRDTVGPGPYLYADYAEAWAPLMAGQTYSSLVDEKTGANADLNIAVGNYSDLMVPIFVGTQFWGMIGFDNCTEARRYDHTEVLVLRSVAAALGAAITRDNARRAHDEAAARSARLLRAVNSATRRLLETPDFDAALDAALDALFELTGADGVFVNRYVPAERATYPWRDRRRAGLKSLAEYFGPGPWPDDDFAEVAVPLREGRVYRSRTEQRTGGNARANDTGRVVSDVIVPIHVDGTYWGCIGFDNCSDEREWTDDDVAVLQTAAQTVAAAIQRERHGARFVHELQRREALLAAAADAAERLLNAACVEDAMPSVLSEWGAAGGYGRVQWLAPTLTADGDPGHRVTHEWTSSRVLAQRDSAHAVIPNAIMGPAVLATLFEQRRSLAFTPADVLPAARAVFESLGIRATAAVPMWVDQDYVGLLAFDECESDRIIDAFELSAVDTCARTLATALGRERARAREAAVARQALVRQERHVALLAAIAAAAEELLATPDPAQCLDTVLAHIGAVTVAMRAGVTHIDWTFDDPDLHGWQELVHEWTAPQVLRQMDSPHRRFAMRRDDATWTTLFALMEQRGQLKATLADMDEPFRSEQASLGVQWTLAYPITLGGRTWGLLGLDYATAPDDYDDADFSALKTVASAIASAIARATGEARRLEAERQRADDAEALNHLLAGVVAASRALLDADDLDHAVHQWLGTLAQAVNADGAFVGTLGSVNADTVAHMQHHWSRVGVDQPLAIPNTSDFAEWAERLMRGEHVWAHRDQLRDAASMRHWVNTNCWTNLLMPIVAQRQTIGWICFDWRERHPWNPAYATLLRTAADGVSSAMQRHAATAARLRAERERADQAVAAAQALTRRESLISAVADATRFLLTVTDLDAALTQALTVVGAALPAHRIAIVFDEPAADANTPGHWRCTHEWFRSGLTPQVGTPTGAGPYPSRRWWEQLCSGQVVLLRNEFEWAPRDKPPSAILSVPVPYARRCWVSIGCEPDRKWPDYEVAVLATLGTSIAAAFERRDSERAREAEREARVLAERARADEGVRLNALLQTIVTCSRELIGAQDFEPALLRWLEQVGRSTAAIRATFYDIVPHAPSGLRTARMLLEWARPDVAGSVPCSFAQPFVIDPRGGEAEMARMLSGEIAVFHTDEMSGPMREFLQQQGNASVIAVPVYLGDTQWGNLSFDFAERREADPNTLAILQTAADTVAAIINRNEVMDRWLAEREANLDQERLRSAELQRLNLALAHSNHLQAAAAEAASLLASGMDFERAVVAAMGTLAQAIDIDRASLIEFSPDPDTGKTRWQLIYEWDAPGVARQMGQMTDGGDFDDLPALVEVLQRPGGIAQFNANDAPDPTFRALLREWGTQSSVTGGIWIGDRLWGAFGWDDNKSTRPRSEEELTAIAMLSHAAAQAIDRQRLQRQIAIERETHLVEVELRNRDLSRANQALADSNRLRTATAQASAVLASHPDFETAVVEAMGIVAQAADFDRAGLIEYVDAEGRHDVNSWRLSYEWRRDGVTTQLGGPYTSGTHDELPLLLQQLLQRDGTVAFATAHAPDPAFRKLQEAVGARYYVAGSLWIDDQAWGSFGCDDCHSERPRTAEEIAMVAHVARAAALAIHRRRLERQIAAERDAHAQAQETRSRELAAANESIRAALAALVRTRDFDAFLCDLLQASMTTVAAQTGAIALLDGSDVVSYPVLITGQGRVPVAEQAAAGLDRGSIASDAARTFLASLNDDTDRQAFATDVHWISPVWRQFHATAGNRSMRLVPLFTQQGLVGWIALGFADTGERADGQIALLRLLAGQITLAVELTRLARQARDAELERERSLVAELRAAELARANLALRRSVARLAASGDLQSFLQHILQETVRLLNGAIAQIFLYDATNDTLVASTGVSHDGTVHPAPGLMVELPLAQPFPARITGAWQKMIDAGRPVAFDLTADVDLFWPGTIDWHTAMGHRGSLCTVISVGDVPLGMLGLAFFDRSEYSAADMEFLQAFAQQAALAIQAARHAETAKQTAVALEREQQAELRAQELLASNAVLQQRDAVLTAAGTFAQMLLGPEPLELTMPRALEALLVVNGVSRALIGRNERDAQGRWGSRILWEAVSDGLPLQRDVPETNPVPLPEYDKFKAAFAQGARGVESLAQPAGSHGDEVQSRVQALATLWVPIMVDGQWWGIFAVDNCQERRRWSEAEKSVLRAVAASAAFAVQREAQQMTYVALERRRIEEQLLERERIAQARADELAQAHDALARSIIGLSNDGDLSRFMALMIAEAQRVSGAQGGVVLELDAARDELIARALVLNGHAVDLTADARLGRFSQPIAAADAMPWHELVRTRDAVWVEIDSPLADRWPASKAWHLSHGQRLVLSLPIVHEARPVGLLGLSFSDPTAPRPDKARLQLLRVLVQQAGLALRLTALARAARDAAVAREQEQAALTRAAALARANDALLRSTASLASDGKLAQFLTTLLHEASLICGARSAAVFIFDEFNESLHMAAFISGGHAVNIASDPEMTMWRDAVPLAVSRPWMKALRTRSHVWFDNEATDTPHPWPVSREWHRRLGHRFIIDVPMYAAGRLIGMLGQCFDTPQWPDTFDLEQTRALAHHAALAVHLDRLATDARDTVVAREREVAAQQRVRELAYANEAMRRSMLKLTSLASLNTFLDSTLIEAARSAGCDAGTFYLIEDGEARLRCLAIDGMAIDVNDERATFALRPDPPLDLRQGSSLVLGRNEWVDLTAHLAQPPNRRFEWHRDRGHRFFVRIPLIAGGRVLGYLGLALGGEIREPDERRVELARSLAQQAAVAVWTSQLAEQSRLAAAATERAQVTQRQLMESNRINAALGRLVGQLQQEQDLEALLPAMLLTCCEILDGAAAFVLMVDDAADQARLHALVLDGKVVQIGAADDGSADGSSAPPLDTLPLEGDAARLWQRLHSVDGVVWGAHTDVEAHDGLNRWITPRGLKEFPLIALRIGAAPVGVFGVAFRQPPLPREACARMVETLAHYVALALRASTLGTQTRDTATLRERNRLARDIHDTLAQGFLGVILHLRAALGGISANAGAKGSAAAAARTRIDDALALAESSLAEARRSVRALKPPALDHLPLNLALAEAVRKQCRGHGIQVRFVTYGSPKPLAEALQAMLLRVCQEAAANAVKHAQARTLAVSLTYADDAVSVELADDGVGFAPGAAQSGFGLRIMRERVEEHGGTLTLDAKPGVGTRLTVRCPLSPTQERNS